MRLHDHACASIGPLAVNGSQPSSIMRSTSSSTKYRTCVTRYPHVSTLQSPKRTERQSNIDCTWVQVVQSTPGKDLVARFSTSCEYIKSINSVTGNEMHNKHGIPVHYMGKTWKQRFSYCWWKDWTNTYCSCSEWWQTSLVSVLELQFQKGANMVQTGLCLQPYINPPFQWKSQGQRHKSLTLNLIR